MSAIYANSSNQIAALKEQYKDDKEYMKDLVYKENPFLAIVPKDESPDGSKCGTKLGHGMIWVVSKKAPTWFISV